MSWADPENRGTIAKVGSFGIIVPRITSIIPLVTETVAVVSKQTMEFLQEIKDLPPMDQLQRCREWLTEHQNDGNTTYAETAQFVQF